ncbi:hypothetical protein COCON_G00210110 [Conger conger]|uniref:Interleukin-2 receptor subunit beta n=1 Tax=Conger conger TaxID=82655 RepID=A0A9Q1D0F1_CONCO|nr:hypothetical protein COCON_G00210110 [Conger conger]
MRSDKSVGAAMEVGGLVYLLLLLAVQSPPCHLQHTEEHPCRRPSGLTCFNNFDKNITCAWPSSETRSRAPCVLHGNYSDLPIPSEANCRLTEGRSCHLVFDMFLFHECKIAMTVTCGDQVADTFEYEPDLCVKWNPPDKPVITNSLGSHIISWSHPQEFVKYELQFKQESEPLWENAETRSIFTQPVELTEHKLKMGLRYQARVRVRPHKDSGVEGVWSSWSPIGSWKSAIGTPKIEEFSSGPGPGPELQMTVGLVAVAVVLLVLIGCKHHRAGWVHKLKLPHVPTPSTYFLSLNSVHRGNFQKWLSPVFAPESFEVPPCFEDTSTAEVSPVKHIAALLASEHPGDPTAQGDSCSTCPSSYDAKVCPVYIGYKSVVVHSGQEGGDDGVDIPLQDTPLQVICSYKQLGGESRQDPGCRQLDGENEEEEEEEDAEEEEEEEEEGDIEGGPKETDTLSPLNAFPCSHFALPPHHPSIPLLAFPFRGFDSDAAPGCCNASGLGRPGFAEIEPSGGGYMSVESARRNISR